MYRSVCQKNGAIEVFTSDFSDFRFSPDTKNPETYSFRLPLGSSVEFDIEDSFSLDRTARKLNFVYGPCIKSVRFEENTIYTGRFDPIPFRQQIVDECLGDVYCGDDLKQLACIIGMLSNRDFRIDETAVTAKLHSNLEFHQGGILLSAAWHNEHLQITGSKAACIETLQQTLYLALRYSADCEFNQEVASIYQNYSTSDTLAFFAVSEKTHASPNQTWEIVTTPAHFIERGREMDFLAEHLNLEFPGCRLQQRLATLDYANEILFFPLKLLERQMRKRSELKSC